jgi:hypothetical protein
MIGLSLRAYRNGGERLQVRWRLSASAPITKLLPCGRRGTYRRPAVERRDLWIGSLAKTRGFVLELLNQHPIVPRGVRRGFVEGGHLAPDDLVSRRERRFGFTRQVHLPLGHRPYQISLRVPLSNPQFGERRFRPFYRAAPAPLPIFGESSCYLDPVETGMVCTISDRHFRHSASGREIVT